MSLLNRQFIQDVLLKDAGFARSHGVIEERAFLSTALTLFSVVYAMPAKNALVLGSGAGFVPRIVRQAQREVPDPHFVSQSKVVLVDAGYEERGDYTFLFEEYPEIVYHKMRTDEALCLLQGERFDYLHIDADHTHAGSLKDFENYLPLMNDEFMITLHDTAIYYKGDGSVPQTVAYLREQMAPGGKYAHLEMINFNNYERNPNLHFGDAVRCAGLALIKPIRRMLMDTSLAPIAAALFASER